MWKAHIVQFTLINIGVSPVGLVIFYYFSVIEGWHPVLAFIPMSTVSTIVSYKAHRRTTYKGDRLHWHTNLRRWAWLKIGMFLTGLLIVGSLTTVGIPGLIAVAANGLAQVDPSHRISRWAFAEVQEAKA